MKFESEAYFRASREHLEFARALYDSNESQSYVIMHYVSGLAVECILRAYLTRMQSEFEGRHDLYQLAKEARFIGLFPLSRREDYLRDFTEIVRRWQNNHRYCTEQKLRSFLKAAKLDRGIKGDFLKENCRRMINAASRLVEIAEIKWKLS